MKISLPHAKFPHEHIRHRMSYVQEILCRLKSCLARGDGIDADGLALLERAVGLAKDHKCYAIQLEETLLSGGTLHLRELLCPFGDYFSGPRSVFPYYPHLDGVNVITTALARVRLGIDGEYGNETLAHVA
ncbi:hypothetical protein ACRCPS_31070 [Pseudomonas aeruginosa]